ncbi:MAG: hypothetical protein IJ223_04290 [Clostridia bacterium]|nr:hypothetical protein [Clostridia bacterium]
MATSGSFNTGYVGNFYFTFEWYRTGYSSSKNQHYIHYTLTAHNAAGKYRTVYLKNLYVNGSQVFYEAGTSGNGRAYYDGNVVTSGDMTINSSNSAGDGSFSASFEAGVGQYPSSNCSGSGSWNLDRIPRYTSITSFSVANISGSDGLTKVKFNWTASDSCDWAWYSTDNGTSWHDLPNTNIISGLSPNTSYNFKLRVRRTDSQLTTDSNKVTKSTYDIAKITSHTSNFNINSNSAVSCTASNPSGASMKYFVDLPNGTRRYTSDATTNKSYTWTAAQILALLQYIPNSNSSTIKFGVATLVGGNETYWHGVVGTLNVVDSNPVFSNFTYEDTNNTTLALTGNNQIIVKGYSSVKGIISVGNKAVAKNGATMSKYRFVIGESQKEANYSSDAEVGITIANANNNTFNMYAIDSRGNSTLKTISPSTYKTYSNIAISRAVAEREDNGIGSRVILSFSGSIWNNNFGAVNNEIVSCQYRYKKTTSNTWITGQTDITPVISGQTFSKTVEIKGDLGAEGFDIQASYDLQIIIRDKLSSYTINTLIGTGTPGIAITADGIAIFNMYDENLGGALQITGDLYVNGVKIN